MVKCVTNELAIVEDEMKLDGVLVQLELGCLHLQKKQKKILLHFSALDYTMVSCPKFLSG